jgi:hypothetical protein
MKKPSPEHILPKGRRDGPGDAAADGRAALRDDGEAPLQRSVQTRPRYAVPAANVKTLSSERTDITLANMLQYTVIVHNISTLQTHMQVGRTLWRCVWNRRADTARPRRPPVRGTCASGGAAGRSFAAAPRTPSWTSRPPSGVHRAAVH